MTLAKNDPYGVAAERQKERERYAAQRVAAENRPNDDRRSHAFTESDIEKLVLSEAKREGALVAGYSLATSGSAVLAANTWSPTFRSRLGVSGKFALVVMPTLGLTALAIEQFIVGAKRDKQTFLDNYLGYEVRKESAAKSHAKLALWKRAANTVYEYPYYTLGLTGTAAVGTVFSLQPKQLSLQQKILHSRVMGQMSVLGILCGVMGFMDFMRRRGGAFTE